MQIERDKEIMSKKFEKLQKSKNVFLPTTSAYT